MSLTDGKHAIINAVKGRRSVRRFLPTAVPDEVVMEIIEVASRAPSGQNMQPWLIHFVTGDVRDSLCREVTAAAAAGERSDDYPYFPQEIREPYLSRRRKVGFDLFNIYGIARDDLEGRKGALLRNFEFFGAPVGLFFVMERDWGLGAWLDIGNVMTNVMTVARAFGLETCPQQAWAEYAPPVRKVLGIPDHQVIVSGMALGHADYPARENQLVTERAAPEEFVIRHR
ncbi:nitroreductase [Sphingomonas sp. SRS2]|uniref:nitroreductase n=1 Tax=Sphingomonas sp. SRS2 TaxID=133190 RepID=UPI0006184E39|nr:nitroreductase [Sphingomonas sp. SRS2]KKC24178.1 nitroreductase [Sphingomonas sp. SRS2]